jgi:hypothetical protein
MKTSELTGELLNYWVARAEGLPAPELYDAGYGEAPQCYYDTERWARYEPTQDWAEGGPIIERMMLDGWGIWRYSDHDEFTCSNTDTEALPFKPNNYDGEWISMEGPTILIAALRAYVASKFGDEVPDEIGGAA